MAKEIRVPLSVPIEAHGKTYDAAVLREPTYADFIALGEPSVTARNRDGTLYAVENDAAVAAYLDRCVVSPDSALLRVLPLVDAIAIKAALVGFFVAARTANLPDGPT